ncbi:helix-turn-helix domain-containing protein [Streptomyces sp. NPDC053367]|uniref:helix-turn-helix domain-containing protein n=1 Tax=Streptomyces sp. NPDC053367 TaxID=3365700 RepID=UPI0037D64AC7
MSSIALVRNPDMFERLPDAQLGKTARDVFDILQARQEPGGLVRIAQKELAARLSITVPSVSRAIGELKDRGLVHPRTVHGRVQIHPLFAAYESMAHMVNTLKDETTHLWPLTFPGKTVPLPSGSDPRSGTGFDPDPDGGEPAPLPDAPAQLRLLAG